MHSGSPFALVQVDCACRELVDISTSRDCLVSCFCFSLTLSTLYIICVTVLENSLHYVSARPSSRPIVSVCILLHRFMNPFIVYIGEN
ncbi:hypothetical protein GDO81_008678 [Engystomops pustulosus]|uniref:Uncharacterized protein n=1 Tax=Engystomops pustulosus TaxID=76066 RepID=A0AAV7CHF9_ENGPU|nr:hypothetical protein GDO81_008678 [Engystomops pustulosus]